MQLPGVNLPKEPPFVESDVRERTEWSSADVKSELKWISDEAGGYNIALRYGRLLDMYVCYAVRGDSAFHSDAVNFRYQNGHKFSFDWLPDSRLSVSYSDHFTGFVQWDRSLKVWKPEVVQEAYRDLSQ